MAIFHVFAFLHKIKDTIGSGGSAVYREIHDAQFSKIMGSTKMFSGIDRRYGLETRFYGPGWSLQGEYLNARLENIQSDGWYVLAAANITNKDIIAVSAERLNDHVGTTIDKPWYILAYSHLFDKHNLKLMVDNRLHTDNGNSFYKSVLQIQIFFNNTKTIGWAKCCPKQREKDYRN